MSPKAYSRRDFLENYFDYRPGEHLAVIEPTGGGKSWLCYQLLAEAMRQNPQLSVMSVMPKPADPSTARWARALNLRETPVWPPRRRLFSGRAAGYVLWPPHQMGVPPAQRREQVGQVLRRGLDDQYRRGSSITFVDDAHSAAVMMGLNEYLEELLVNGRAGGAGGWVALQKPSGSQATGSVSSFVYSSATHLFLGRDNDERNIKRFGEIAGCDPREIHEIVRNLRMFSIDGHAVSEKLYLDMRGSPHRALIGP
jgi:hypothetical protein